MPPISESWCRALPGFALLALLAGCERRQVPGPPPADLVLLDGVVYTVDSADTVATAVAIRDRQIVFVGDTVTARSHAGAHTEVVDLAGRLVLPGLHDIHIHVLEIVPREGCDLDSQPYSLAAMVPVLRQCLREFAPAPGEWLAVQQWNFFMGNQPDGQLPTLRAALDAVSTEHPIILWGNDGHHGAVNSAALARATDAAGRRVGLDRRTLTTDFARFRPLIGVDATGEPNGELHERARELIGPPPPHGPPGAGHLQRVAHLLASRGITSVQDSAMPPAFADILRDYDRDVGLTFRLQMALLPDFDAYTGANGARDIATMIGDLSAVRARYQSHARIRADAVKIFVDGVLEGNPLAVPPTLPNAAVLEAYLQPRFEYDPVTGTLRIEGYVDTDSEACQAVRSEPRAHGTRQATAAFRQRWGHDSAQCTLSRGVLEHSEDYVDAFVAAADRAGFTVHAHAVGDRAVRVAVDAFEKLAEPLAVPHTIAHAQLVHPREQRRIGALGLTMALTYAWIEPGFDYDMSVVPFVSRVDHETLYRADSYYMQHVYPVRSLMQAGAVLAAGSDAPVDTRDPRPFFNVRQAVTRASASGEVLNAAERIDIADILRAYTINGARAMRQQQRLGSIEPGKLADLIVLDRDIVALARTGYAADIADAAVDLTVFDGRVVYRRDRP